MVAATTSRLNVELDLRNEHTFVTWNADRSGILVRLSSAQGDVALDLGPDAIAQLKQALTWAGDSVLAVPSVRKARRLTLLLEPMQLDVPGGSVFGRIYPVPRATRCTASTGT